MNFPFNGPGNSDSAPGSEPSVADDEFLQRQENSLGNLNMRIARLAIALDIDLSTDAGLSHALDLDWSETLRHHQRDFFAELQGLLTLRYQQEKYLSDQLGGETLTKVLVDIERHMELAGFKRGMDGIREEQLTAN